MALPIPPSGRGRAPDAAPPSSQHLGQGQVQWRGHLEGQRIPGDHGDLTAQGLHQSGVACVISLNLPLSLNWYPTKLNC